MTIVNRNYIHEQAHQRYLTRCHATIAVLDRVATKGDRSKLISQAVLHYVKTRSAANLKERLKQGALANPNSI